MVWAYFFILGLICGSFANAVIWRVHTKRSFVKGRSICVQCKKQIRNRDLIPVLSWLILRGKCRDCKVKISIQYPIVELLTGVLFVLVWWHIRPSAPVGWVNLAFWLYITLSLVILAVYDLKWMLLPDVVLVPAIVAAAVHLPLLWLLGQPVGVLKGPVIAAAVAGSAFYALAALSKGKWMGGGDIKLVFLMGLLLGIQKTGLALFLATGVAALVGSVLIVSRRMRSHYIAFGPFLAAATLVAFLYGSQIIHWYLGLSGLTELTF